MELVLSRQRLVRAQTSSILMDYNGQCASAKTITYVVKPNLLATQERRSGFDVTRDLYTSSKLLAIAYFSFDRG